MDSKKNALEKRLVGRIPLAKEWIRATSTEIHHVLVCDDIRMTREAAKLVTDYCHDSVPIDLVPAQGLQAIWSEVLYVEAKELGWTVTPDVVGVTSNGELILVSIGHIYTLCPDTGDLFQFESPLIPANMLFMPLSDSRKSKILAWSKCKDEFARVFELDLAAEIIRMVAEPPILNFRGGISHPEQEHILYAIGSGPTTSTVGLKESCIWRIDTQTGHTSQFTGTDAPPHEPNAPIFSGPAAPFPTDRRQLRLLGSPWDYGLHAFETCFVVVSFSGNLIVLDYVGESKRPNCKILEMRVYNRLMCLSTRACDVVLFDTSGLTRSINLSSGAVRTAVPSITTMNYIIVHFDKHRDCAFYIDKSKKSLVVVHCAFSDK